MRHNKHSTSPQPGNLINATCMALLGLLIVVLSHQFMLAALSKSLGYQTNMVFGKVTSAPFENQYWSDNRVLVMYAFPPVLYLLLAVAAALYLHFTRQVTTFYRLLFWCMVFSLLFISAQLTLAPWASLVGKGPVYQGPAVVANWWGVQSQQLFWLTFVSLLLNLLLGFLSFKMVLQLSPSLSAIQKREGQRMVIRQQFIYPLLITAVPALLLAYPATALFFLALFIHALLWLPGLFIKTRPGFRYKGTITKSPPVELSYTLIVVLVVAVVLIRIFM
ncbi:MAG: hypothetical protein KA149_03550 [Chitinophagales bacterium]|nr:hypothetical protein [Chitinophagales bacterium]